MLYMYILFYELQSTILCVIAFRKIKVSSNYKLPNFFDFFLLEGKFACLQVLTFFSDIGADNKENIPRETEKVNSKD